MSGNNTNVILFTRNHDVDNNNEYFENVKNYTSECRQHCMKCSLCPNRKFFVGSLVKYESGFLHTNRGNFKLSYTAARALCLLQRNIDEFVSKEHIKKYVWGASPIVDNNVNVVISELRTALFNTGLHILNQRKVGYMLIEVGI